MTDAERNHARDVFGGSIDYDKVRISRGSLLALFSGTAIANAINLRGEHFVAGSLDLSDEGKLALIHELAHVWQFQNGGLSYIPSSLIAQAIAWLRTGSRHAAYDWRKAKRAGTPWVRWNAEQQAQCISDYDEARRRIADGTGRDGDAETVALSSPHVERLHRP